MGHLNLIYGDVLFPFLVIMTILWDWKRGFRGIVQQLLGALFVGAGVNAVVNVRITPFIMYIVLAFLFYWWALHRRTKAVVRKSKMEQMNLEA